MKNYLELYLTTEESAGILGVKKHTLSHYGQTSLLSPALKEENGYRYYFVWQTDVSEMIKALQKLGMPLEEIRGYMENRSLERSMAMMDNKEAQIDEEIERLKNMKRFIRNEKQNIREALIAGLDTLNLVRYRADFLLVPDVSAQDERKVVVDMTEHMRTQGKYHGIMEVVGSICLEEDLEQGTCSRYIKAYTRLEKRASSSKVMIRSGGGYVGVCRKGYNWDMETPYRLIPDFARHGGLSISRIWCEDLMVDELTVTDYEDYIVKVVIPVERIGG